MSKPRPLPPQRVAASSSDQGGFFRGILGLLFLPIYLTWIGTKTIAFWIWHAPRSIQAVMACLFLLVLGGMAYVGNRVIQTRKAGATNYLWAEFSTAAFASDVEGMTKSLNSIIAAKPDDVYAKGRLAALETGIADPSDGVMCWLMTRIHLRNDRVADAAREARKKLASEPRDWLSNCVLAKDALNRNEKDEALPYLEQIGNPEATPSKPDLGLILFAVELREKGGVDSADLRAFLLTRVLPNLKNMNLGLIKPAAKVQIVFSYSTSVAAIPEVGLSSTLQYWAFTAQLADQTVVEAAAEKNAAVLNQIGSLQSVLSFCVTRYLKTGLIRPEQANEMSKEIDARGEATWRALRDVSPNDVNAYAGVAAYLIKANKFEEAEKEIIDGLKNAQPYPQLLRLFVITAAHRNRPEEALQLALAVAKKNPDIPATWQVVIEAAMAARRRDLAINACQEARKAKPDLPWVDGVEASLWLETGDPHKALQIFTNVPEPIRRTTPFIAKAYAKALSASGNDVLAPEFVRSVVAEAESKNIPALAQAVISGMSEVLPTSARADFIVEQLDRILAKWPSVPEVQIEGQWAKANALFQSAELSKPRWEPSRLERALLAYKSLSYQFPLDPRSIERQIGRAHV